jgi:ABC-type branched-subunit amino acid transport system substrate-binding protein
MRVKGVVRWRHLRPAAALLSAAVVAAAIAGPAGAASKTAGVYKVAVVAPLSGAFSNQGQPYSDGVHAAFLYVNAHGGIDGRNVQVSNFDDQSSTTQSPVAAQSAVSSHPTAIFDEGSSSVYEPRLPVYESAKIPVFSGGGYTGNTLAWQYTDNLTFAQEPEMYVPMATFALGGKIKGARVGFIYSDTPGGHAEVPSNAKLFAAKGAKIVDSEFQTVGAASFTSGAANMVAAKPQVVIIVDTDADAIVETKALRSAGYKGPVVGNDFAGAISTFSTLDDAHYFAQEIVKAVQPGTLAYATAKKYGLLSGVNTSSTEFGLGWADAYTVADALLKCNSSTCSPAELEKATDSLGHYSIPGGITWAKLFASKNDHTLTQVVGLFGWSPAKKKIVIQKEVFPVK